MHSITTLIITAISDGCLAKSIMVLNTNISTRKSMGLPKINAFFIIFNITNHAPAYKHRAVPDWFFL